MSTPHPQQRLGGMSEFNPKSDNIRSYFERFENFVDINEVPAAKKLKLFLNVVGGQAYEELKKILVPQKPTDKTFEQVRELLENHFSPEYSVIAERCKFNRRVQQEGESVKDFMTELKHLARNCEFKAFLNEALRDRLVAGLRDEETQRILFATEGLTFEGACKIALEKELASRQTSELRTAEARPTEVHAISGGTCGKTHASRSKNQEKETKRETHASRLKKEGASKTKRGCYRCGKGHAPDRCWYRNTKCRACAKTGHLEAMCQEKKRRPINYVDTSDDDSGASQVYHVVLCAASDKRGYKVSVNIEGKPISMLLDTGAAVTLIPESIYKANFAKVSCKPTKVSLRTYTGEPLKIKGKAAVNVEHNGRSATLPLFVVEDNQRTLPALLGRDWLEELQLDWKAVCAVTEDDKVRSLKEKFPEVFRSTPGVVSNYEAKVVLKANSTPVYCKARPIPFATKEAVAAELRRLENDGIVKRVTHSDWATPVVVVPKRGGGIRLCGDYKVTINQVLKTDCYPLPLPEDLYSMLAGGKVFCVLDLSSAFQQVPLSEEAKPLLTINTHLGLFEYQRLPFGIASAPAIFQALMDKVLEGIPNVGCYIDDVIVTGSSKQDCYNSVTKVLRRLRDYNITLKEEKCEFFRDSVVYLGHKVSAEGIYPTSTKIKAIRDAPEPTNITELRAYLGLLNFYAKFLRNFATVAEPLYSLLKKEHKWRWSKECRKAFEATKDMFINSDALTFFDATKPIGLSCDSSAYGLGAVIFHEMPDGSERPIAFASRTLTSSERNYAQGEKEALAIIFGLKRFHRYLYGRSFSLYTDHQPLVGILGQDKPIPTLAAARIQRWAVTLSAYQYKLKFRNGHNMQVADALSRLPLAAKDKDDDPECLAVFDAMPLTAQQVARETKRDLVLTAVINYTLSGWPRKYPEEMQAFFVRRDELSVEGGCLTWGHRVIIPKTLQAHVLALLHEAHPGMTRMKMLARSYVWWPLLDKEVEDTVRLCRICQSVLPAKTPGPLQPWPYPTRVWQRVHADYAVKDGVNLLVLVDAYSKWIEVFCMSKTTSAQTAQKLDTLFAAYGYPEELVTDNGPQFTSDEFQEFLQHRGIRHTRTPPYHAASNGAAERLVRTTKTALLKQVLCDNLAGVKRTTQERLNDFLLSYRCTPSSVTAKTPAELFLKRVPRIKLSLLKPCFAGDMADRQQRSADQLNQQRGPAEFFCVNEKVYVKTTRGEVESWQEGIVEQVVSPATYLVRVKDNVRFTHADHLRKRWCMAPRPSFTSGQHVTAIPDSRPDDQRNPWKNSQSTEASSAVEELHDRALSSAQEPQLLNEGSPYSYGQAEGNGRSSPATSSHGVADFDGTRTAPGNAGEATSTAARVQGEAPALRRSNRTRRPPDKYQADDFRAKAK